MPSQASCSLPIDFPSVLPPPSKSREGRLLRARAALLLSQASSGPGLQTDPALLISTESMEGLQTSDDNPRCCRRKWGEEDADGRGGSQCVSSSDHGGLDGPDQYSGVQKGTLRRQRLSNQR